MIVRCLTEFPAYMFSINQRLALVPDQCGALLRRAFTAYPVPLPYPWRLLTFWSKCCETVIERENELPVRSPLQTIFSPNQLKNVFSKVNWSEAKGARRNLSQWCQSKGDCGRRFLLSPVMGRLAHGVKNVPISTHRGGQHQGKGGLVGQPVSVSFFSFYFVTQTWRRYLK